MTEKEKFLEMIRLHEGWIPGKSWQSQMVERVDFLLSELDRVTAERDAQRNANGLLGQERDEARAQVAQLREALSKCLSVHEDIGCSCEGCAALRKALAATEPKP